MSRIPLAVNNGGGKDALTVALALALVLHVAGCAIPDVGGSSDFIEKIKARTSHVEVADIKASDGALSLSLSLDEEVDGGEIRETLKWVTLYFAETKRTYFHEMQHGEVPLDAWNRYEVITVVGSVGEQQLFTWKLDETRIGLPDVQPITGTESTSLILPNRVIRGSDADEFRQALLTTCPDVQDVVLERLIFLQASVVVKLMAGSAPGEESITRAKELVLNDLLERPSIAAEDVALALIEVYAAGERVGQYAWDNWAGRWIEGDWPEHTFEGPVGE